MPTTEPTPPALLARLRAGSLRLSTYLVTGFLVRIFWLFESTLDIRAFGTENLRLCKRAGERPLLVLWHGKGFVPMAYFHHEQLCLYASHDRDPNYTGLKPALRLLT